MPIHLVACLPEPWVWVLHGGSSGCSLSEYQVKALFLLNFANTLIGQHLPRPKPMVPSPLACLAKTIRRPISKKSSLGKTLADAALCPQIESAGDVENCSILSSAFGKGTPAEILDGVKDSPILTVGKARNFSNRAAGSSSR